MHPAAAHQVLYQVKSRQVQVKSQFPIFKSESQVSSQLWSMVSWSAITGVYRVKQGL